MAASERSAGKPYREAARWLEGQLSDELADSIVLPCDPDKLSAPIVFSALDAAAAGDLEPAFARSGALVLSNAKNFRMVSIVNGCVKTPEAKISHHSRSFPYALVLGSIIARQRAGSASARIFSRTNTEAIGRPMRSIK